MIGVHLALIALALIAPIVFEPEGTRKAVACALIFGPGVALVTATAVHLRRSGEARDRAYREFANDALALASRIRSRVGPRGRRAAAGKSVARGPGAGDPAAQRRDREGRPHGDQRSRPCGTHSPPLRDYGARRRRVGDRRGRDDHGDRSRRARTGGGRQVLAGARARCDGADRGPQAGGAGASAATPSARPRGTRGDRGAGVGVDRAGHRARRRSSESAQGGAPEDGPTAPAPSAGGQSPVPTRRRRPRRSHRTRHPTPVQQGAPAGAIQSTLSAVQQNVGPLVPDLKP